MADFNSPLYTQIVKGLANGIFQTAWASEAEEAGISLSQKRIEDVAPETPDYANLHAAYVVGKLESSNGLPLASIYSQACAADGVNYEEVCRAGRDELDDIDKADALMGHAEEFGFCLGMMATGTGVSWYDNHERFDLRDGINPPKPMVVPLTEFHIDPLPRARGRELPIPNIGPELGMG